MRRLPGHAAVLTALLAPPSGAAAAPRPSDAFPEGTLSVRIVRGDEPLRLRPGATTPRRGSARLGAQLPVFASAEAPGCPVPWLLVGPLAWVCGSGAEASFDPALPAGARPGPFPDGLPFRYHFVRAEGSLAYRQLLTAEDVAPAEELQPGFAVGVIRVAEKPHTRERFGLTTHGLWVPMRDVAPVREQTLDGVHLADGRLDFAWSFADDTPLLDQPGGKRRRGHTLLRHERVPVLAEETRRGRTYLRVAEADWVAAADVRRPTLAPPPASALPGERWIDVHLEQQALVAYQGAVPVFAALVSTGKGPRGSERATPPGEHRIWVKLMSTDMDNLESEEAEHLYAMQAVPWVMFFERGYGLHGTFWHRSFGKVRSHGCVNLAPRDAEWLFHWTSPRLPAGWSAVLPTEHDPGTLVRVRE